jgi:cytochrome c oxidase cbb3-type subunit 3
MKNGVALGFALVAVLVAACEREDREFRSDPAGTESDEQISMVSIAPGQTTPEAQPSGMGRQYEENAYHVSQGKKYYTWFNCVGCHHQGGGGSGPALIDDKWVYGGSIENIVATIREGRPNGMPSFRGKLTDEQIWQIAAYVRSMGRYIAQDVAPGRNDDLSARPSENRLPASAPLPGGGIPHSAQVPQ